MVDLLQWWKCGTIGSVWLNLFNDVLPDVDQQRQGISCLGCDGDCCDIWSTSITVMNCRDFFVYFLNPTPVASNRGYCVTIES